MFPPELKRKLSNGSQSEPSLWRGFRSTWGFHSQHESAQIALSVLPDQELTR